MFEDRRHFVYGDRDDGRMNAFDAQPSGPVDSVSLRGPQDRQGLDRRRETWIRFCVHFGGNRGEYMIHLR
ncbi:hypothetical protein MKK69_28510 [Methylobacterium sp. J-026]|uniref:hypothetical protein n=1 Tax=Methylobacterium sp. J-026 TaxID=2836624 RepID=UPI001FB983D5|nr:hypothetical protein [Methylobacterium sp. J-026]MCJ2137944.1 hypothetical protein [Methylobacterium sp. J-026]